LYYIINLSSPFDDHEKDPHQFFPLITIVDEKSYVSSGLNLFTYYHYNYAWREGSLSS
jgi:hypothetical protein